MLSPMCCERYACPAHFSSTCTRARRGWRRRRPARAWWTRCFPGSDHLISYHADHGRRLLGALEGEEPIKLFAGDIVVLPHGDTHVLTTELGMRKAPNMAMYRMPDDGRLPVKISVGTEGGEPAHFVCGFLGCDSRPYNPLLTALPRVIHINDHASGALGAYFRAALAESQGTHGRRDACSAASAS